MCSGLTDTHPHTQSQSFSYTPLNPNPNTNDIQTGCADSSFRPSSLMFG